MRTYKDRGHFMLSGDFDPAFISARLGLEPDFTRIKGELDPETGHPYIVSLWCLKCSDEAMGGVVDQITFLLRRLGPHSDNVASLVLGSRDKWNLWLLWVGVIRVLT